MLAGGDGILDERKLENYGSQRWSDLQREELCLQKSKMTITKESQQGRIFYVFTQAFQATTKVFNS